MADTISYDDAVALLPERDEIHTYRAGGVALIGADWDREVLLAAMRKAPEIHLTGPSAQAMRHGLAIFDDHGPLFIETKPQAAPDDPARGTGERSTLSSAPHDQEPKEDLVQEIREALSAATPRPWRPGKRVDSVVADWAVHNGHKDTKEGRIFYGGALVGESMSEPNRRLVAAAPDLLHRAAQEIERLREERDAVRRSEEHLRKLVLAEEEARREVERQLAEERHRRDEQLKADLDRVEQDKATLRRQFSAGAGEERGPT